MGPTYLRVGVQGVGQLTGPVTGRRVPQDRVKRLGRCSPRASGQRHGQQQQWRQPQLGLDPKLPLRRRHLVRLCHSRSACCCFLFRVSPSSGPAPFPAPPASASDSASSSAPPRLLPLGPPVGLGGLEDLANPLGCGHGEAPASFSARPTGACNSPHGATAAARLAVRSGKCSSRESPPRNWARPEVYQLIPKRGWTGRVSEVKRLSCRQAEISGGSHVEL